MPESKIVNTCHKIKTIMSRKMPQHPFVATVALVSTHLSKFPDIWFRLEDAILQQRKNWEMPYLICK